MIFLHFILQAMAKTGILKGTRDFGPEVMMKRNFIFDTIRSTFEKFGFLPIETPAMERLETLTGKYGEEGDQLIFKILNNGQFLDKVNDELYQAKDSKKLSFAISKRALKYDLTVPFARFVVMNQSNLAFPFKRYQIQPVWREDRPGKGRYQEFYQCDVDIIGSDSLLNEVELVQIFDEVLSKLQLPNFQIKLNNRKILSGIAVAIGAEDQFVDLCTALDKLDKIGKEKVLEELKNRGLSDDQLAKLDPIFDVPESASDKLNFLRETFGNDTMSKGLEELEEVLNISEQLGINDEHLIFDPLLARGLNYYTGAIFEVAVPDSGIGSICGGGRYDDLTGIFGLPNMSGVGVSFGADRIYDVMEHFNLFPETTTKTSELMFVNFGKEEQLYCMKLLQDVRNKGVKAELYPSSAKMQKQMKYANQKGIKYVALVGSREMETGEISIKNMDTGEQNVVHFSEIVEHIS